MKNDTMNRPRRERVNVDEVIGHLQEREAIECRRIEKGFTLRAEQRSQSWTIFDRNSSMFDFDVF